MAQARRTGSRNSLPMGKNGNQSNSNSGILQRSASSENQKLSSSQQRTKATGIKVLGQEEEITEDMLRDDMQSDRMTPLSSRSNSKIGSRPVSSGFKRTPTPSKQVSLQAVKRKEEKEEVLGPIDWNDFKEPVYNINNRVPNLPVSGDSDSDIDLSPRSSQMSESEHQALVEKRAREMELALNSHRMDDMEADLSRKLDLIETEREELERRHNEEEEQYTRRSGEGLTVEDGQFTYRNEHFRDLSKRDDNDKISSTFIFDGKSMKGASGSDETVKVGSQSVKRRGENVIGRHAMDKQQETAVATETKVETNQDATESSKKNEASAKSDEEDGNSSDEDSDEEDLIGERGKAPNALLMEFLTCMMQEDYENAEKLCKMILIYEPENEEALSFYPLIQEKIKQEDEESEGDSSDDSDDSGEEEDGSDDDDDDDDDDESGSEDSNEDDNDDVLARHPDSGIASANSD